MEYQNFRVHKRLKLRQSTSENKTPAYFDRKFCFFIKKLVDLKRLDKLGEGKATMAIALNS